MPDVAVHSHAHAEPLFVSAPGRWLWIWSAGFLAAVAISTLMAVHSSGSWPKLLHSSGAPFLAVLLALLVLWSVTGILLGRRAFRSVTARLIFVAVCWGLCFWISALNADYGFLMYSAVLQAFIFLPSTWAIPALLAFGSLSVARVVVPELQSGSAVNPWDVLGPVALMSCLVVVMLYIQRVNRESAVRQTLIEQLGAAQRQLATREHAAGIADERARLSRDLHDTLAQQLVSVVTQLSAAELALAQGPGGAEVHLRRAQHTARSSLADIRRLVRGLRPGELQVGQIELALRRVLDRWSDETGTRAEFQLRGQPVALEAQAEVALLRCLQEALSNVGCHAQATAVTVSLSFGAEVVTLAVHDDGTGFDPDLTLPDLPQATSDLHHMGLQDVGLRGMGLQGMRERATALGGRTLLESGCGQGTQVLMALPIRQAGWSDQFDDRSSPVAGPI